MRISAMLALDDTPLGMGARAVALPMGIEIRADREPERGMIQRADHWPFLEPGVPAALFTFRYDPGTGSEPRYRTWYRTRYPKPQDDLTQPWDAVAARDMNRFVRALAARVADAPERPAFLPTSLLAPR